MIDPTTFEGFREHVSEERYRVLAQPIVDLASGETLHHEWLVRFDHDDDLVSLIRPAEISGAIRDLDLSMLARAVLALNAEPERTPIAVNLSGASFATPSFKHALTACIGALEAPPKKLVIELTESWDIRDLAQATDVLAMLRRRGHHICLDDVGSGAASIRYLRALPCDWLKIDGEFVAAAAENARDRAILEAVLSLREPLQVRFIAEGIENETIMALVRELGFDAGQGYAIARPALSVPTLSPVAV